MAGVSRLQLCGKRFVVIEEPEYERLQRISGGVDDDQLPPLPLADRNGLFPALEYARASLARDLIRDRKSAGLSQLTLARMAGVRQETLSRIERAKHTAHPKTVEKIVRALDQFRTQMRSKTKPRVRSPQRRVKPPVA